MPFISCSYSISTLCIMCFCVQVNENMDQLSLLHYLSCTGGFGAWSGEGCMLTDETSTQVTCTCNRLGTLAVIQVRFTFTRAYVLSQLPTVHPWLVREGRGIILLLLDFILYIPPLISGPVDS